MVDKARQVHPSSIYSPPWLPRVPRHHLQPHLLLTGECVVLTRWSLEQSDSGSGGLAGRHTHTMGMPQPRRFALCGCHSPRLNVSQNQRTLVLKELQCHLALLDLNNVLQTICGVGKVPRQFRVTVAFGEDSSIVLSAPVTRLTTTRFQPQEI